MIQTQTQDGKKTYVALPGDGPPYLAGLVVLAETGVVYSNQTGGCCCAHPPELWS